MSEQFAEHLSRFTPDGSGLDRDAVLFEAGRASARPNRRWLALAGTLAACQLLTLTLLWPRPAALTDNVAKTPPAVAPGRAPEVTPAEGSLAVLRERALATDGNLPASETLTHVVADEAPLRAFAVSLGTDSD